MTRIIDAFPFFQEYDLYAIRCAELAGIALPVAVTANRTHSGAAHSAILPDALTHTVDLSNEDGNASLAATRRREMRQRNGILGALAALRLADDDLIMISDCDEIPRREAVKAAADYFKTAPDGTVVVVRMDLFYYDIQTRAVPRNCWNGTRIARYADVKALTPHIVRYGIALPDHHYPHYVVIENGGWHCSYFGGADAVASKMQSFLHQELVTTETVDRDGINARIAERRDAYGRNDMQFEAVSGDDAPAAMTRQRYPWFFRSEGDA
jgi:hypothetical protein